MLSCAAGSWTKTGSGGSGSSKRTFGPASWTDLAAEALEAKARGELKDLKDI